MMACLAALLLGVAAHADMPLQIQPLIDSPVIAVGEYNDGMYFVKGPWFIVEAQVANAGLETITALDWIVTVRTYHYPA